MLSVKYLVNILSTSGCQVLWNADNAQLNIEMKKFEKDIMLVGIQVCRQAQIEGFLKGNRIEPILNLMITKKKMSTKSRSEIRSLKGIIRNMKIRVFDRHEEI